MLCNKIRFWILQIGVQKYISDNFRKYLAAKVNSQFKNFPFLKDSKLFWTFKWIESTNQPTPSDYSD